MTGTELALTIITFGAGIVVIILVGLIYRKSDDEDGNKNELVLLPTTIDYHPHVILDDIPTFSDRYIEDTVQCQTCTTFNDPTFAFCRYCTEPLPVAEEES